MERLTLTREQRKAEKVTYAKYVRPDVLQEWDKKLAAYEDTELTPERAAELAQADREGRLAVLPCRAGDVLYAPIVEELPDENYVSDDCSVGRLGFTRITRCDGMFDDFVTIEEIGKTVFLTREEAEAALKGRETR